MFIWLYSIIADYIPEQFAPSTVIQGFKFVARPRLYIQRQPAPEIAERLVVVILHLTVFPQFIQEEIFFVVIVGFPNHLGQSNVPSNRITSIGQLVVNIGMRLFQVELRHIAGIFLCHKIHKYLHLFVREFHKCRLHWNITFRVRPTAVSVEFNLVLLHNEHLF